MILHRQRKAFSMLTAIFVIVLMGAVGAMVMSLSGKMVKETTTQYQREQSMLLAKSYTEYAIMAVMANGNRNIPNQCLNQITGAFGVFNIDVQISYISDNVTDTTQCANVLAENVITTRTPLNIIVDVYVSYRDDRNMNMTYHKRTLQKI